MGGASARPRFFERTLIKYYRKGWPHHQFKNATDMNTYIMTCACGDKMDVQAATRDEAVKKLQGMMDEGAIKKHMSEKHPNDPVMSVADCHSMIAKTLQPMA